MRARRHRLRCAPQRIVQLLNQMSVYYAGTDGGTTTASAAGALISGRTTPTTSTTTMMSTTTTASGGRLDLASIALHLRSIAAFLNGKRLEHILLQVRLQTLREFALSRYTIQKAATAFWTTNERGTAPTMHHRGGGGRRTTTSGVKTLAFASTPSASPVPSKPSSFIVAVPSSPHSVTTTTGGGAGSPRASATATPAESPRRIAAKKTAQWTVRPPPTVTSVAGCPVVPLPVQLRNLEASIQSREARLLALLGQQALAAEAHGDVVRLATTTTAAPVSSTKRNLPNGSQPDESLESSLSFFDGTRGPLAETATGGGSTGGAAPQSVDKFTTTTDGSSTSSSWWFLRTTDCFCLLPTQPLQHGFQGSTKAPDRVFAASSVARGVADPTTIPPINNPSSYTPPPMSVSMGRGAASSPSPTSMAGGTMTAGGGGGGGGRSSWNGTPFDSLQPPLLGASVSVSVPRSGAVDDGQLRGWHV